jgi:hypothetical protein
MKLWLIPLLVFILFLVTACSVTETETPVAQPLPATPISAPTIAATTHTPAAEPTQGVVEATVAIPQPVAKSTTVATTEIVAATTPTPEAVDWLTVEGKTADNLTYLGNPDAPVTLIDYSDFL